MKGGFGLADRGRFLTSETLYDERFSNSTSRADSSSLETSVFFLPTGPTSRALNAPFFANMTSIVQYSSEMKAVRARSRSAVMRRATVCTRPADSPLATVRESQRLTFLPTSQSRASRAC